MAKKRSLKQVTIQIDEDIKSWADGQAEEAEVSLAWVLRRVLRLGFDELKRREGDSNPARPSHLHRQKKPTEPATAASVA